MVFAILRKGTARREKSQAIDLRTRDLTFPGAPLYTNKYRQPNLTPLPRCTIGANTRSKA